MSQDQENKTEQATPHKLEEARKQGQSSKSNDVNVVMGLALFTAVFLAVVDEITSKLARISKQLLMSAGEVQLNAAKTLPWLEELGMQTLYLLTPILITLLITGVLSNVFQTGPIFSSVPLKPDFTRLNPVAGLKKLFSMKIIFELIKNLIKISAICLLFYYGAKKLLPFITQLVSQPLIKIPMILKELFGLVAFWIVGVLLIIALIDYFYSKREFAKKMRMSHRDLKDEHKKREGDPDIKSKRKQKQSELLKQTLSLGKVKEADVIVTNPTHYAIALKYCPNEMVAPKVISKGAGIVAGRIRRLGNRYGVPIVRSPALARALFRECSIDDTVPQSSYSAIAPLFRWLANLPGCKWNGK